MKTDKQRQAIARKYARRKRGELVMKQLVTIRRRQPVPAGWGYLPGAVI